MVLVEFRVDLASTTIPEHSPHGMERAAVTRRASSPRPAMDASVHRPSGNETALFAPAFKSASCSAAGTRHCLVKEPTAHSAPIGRRPRSRGASGPHPCAHCGKTFCRKYELAQHLRRHTGEEFECSECGRKFVTRGNLNRHLRGHAKVYACGLCGEKYTTRKQFNAHSKTHSTEESPHECQECHKTFSRFSDLSAHRIIHAREKYYECHTCQKRCATRHGFTTHLRTHQDVAGYKCNICKTTFLYRWFWHEHMRTHSCTLTEPAVVETEMCLEPVPENAKPDFVWYSNASSF